MTFFRTVLLILIFCGCAQKEKNVCLQRRLAANQAALADRLDEAEEILAQVEGQCGPNHESGARRVTRLIAKRRKFHAARKKRTDDSAEQRRLAPSQEFSSWAGSYGGSLHGKVTGAVCAKRGQPDFGFCEAARAHVPGTTVRFWNENRKSYRYALRTALPITCGDLGSYRRVRSWGLPSKRYELCELTGQKVRHLSALLVRTPDENQMFIYSLDYPKYDEDFQRSLRPSVANSVPQSVIESRGSL